MNAKQFYVNKVFRLCEICISTFHQIMSNDQDKTLFDNVLSNRSVVINEGVFLLRVNSSEINQSEFLKQCLYGDAFPSAYSPNVSMIPTGVFLPQMFLGKNVFMEYRDKNMKQPLLDSFVPFAFWIHPEGHKEVKNMYDKVFETSDNLKYSDLYENIKKSALHHLKEETKRKNCFNNNLQSTYTEEDKVVRSFFEENSDCYTIMIATHASAVRLLQAKGTEIRFGNENECYYVPVASNGVAKFDGYTTSETCNVRLPERISLAIKSELLTLTQFFVGSEKQPTENVESYVRNINFLFNNHLKSIQVDNEENVESYCVAALKLFLSRNLEMDEIVTTSPILSDASYQETIRKKILYQLVMLLDVGSTFNFRLLCKRETSKGKPMIVCKEPYTNPFTELCRSLYGNPSWITHICTMCMFFSRIKNRKCCETCEQKHCAISAPSLLFTFSSSLSTFKKERTSALLCFYTSNNFNRTGPFGNLKSSEGKGAEASKLVNWEKHHRDLLQSLLDSYNIDLSVFSQNTNTDENNIEERSERLMEKVCSYLDNIITSCEQFCQELDEGAESFAQANNVESEIRNTYKLSSMYDKGFVNMLLSESLQYLLRCLVLFENTFSPQQSVNDVFLKIRPLLLDIKSGFVVSHANSLRNVSIPKIAVKSYLSDDILIDAQSKLTENYNIDEILYNISFKCKTYLYGRYNEAKNNGYKKKGQMLQNMVNKKGCVLATVVSSNSFLYFKNFCSKQACEVLGIQDDDFCRDVFNDIRDETLNKYAFLFKYVSQFKVENWPTLIFLVSVVKMLEHLRFQPSYDKLALLTFNKLSQGDQKKLLFEQSMFNDEFNRNETIYTACCNMIEYSAEIQGKQLCFRKCTAKYLESYNELLNSFSQKKLHPGYPLYFFTFRVKNEHSLSAGGLNIMTAFLNEEQYKLENDAAYTNYIKKYRKQFYDCVFDATFSEQGSYIENRYSSDILEEMMSEFDDRFPCDLFVNEKVHKFLKLVLLNYLNSDQNEVTVMAKRLRETYNKAKERGNKRRRDEEFSTFGDDNLANDEEDTEDQFLCKKQKLS